MSGALFMLRFFGLAVLTTVGTRVGLALLDDAWNRDAPRHIIPNGALAACAATACVAITLFFAWRLLRMAGELAKP